MNRRIRVMAQTLLGAGLRSSPKNYLSNVFCQRAEGLAAPHIISCDVREGFYELRLRGHDTTLYIDEKVRFHSICQVIAEQCRKWNWHNYNIPQTSPEGQIVIDVGCAEGIFPYLYSTAARRIYCFEPLPLFVHGLRRTFATTESVTVVESAVGSVSGTLFLKENGMESFLLPDSKPGSIPVPVTTIDRFCSEQNILPTYIKADLEGFEMEMLAGAAEIIKASKPRIAVTTYHKPEHHKEIRAFLEKCRPDYKVIEKGVEDRWGAPVMLHAW